ncbi:tyrosine-type recombinase/integrase [Clostridium perfringens]|uniref:tyrosine-type recombinase/integrase n=1 Tax=Clostridium perfringens TaxID=1502 RepID=UPI000D71C0C3|nr:tyrosine-type recombinase/integrase [Clostridium perfringens]PWX20924.1 integrase [Clostridium perfringens]TPG00077.1 integrase [Clostridium perfringens A]
MKKIKINLENDLTFKEGFSEFIYNCKVRNLRSGTIKHYEEAYISIIRYFDEDILIKNINKKVVDDFIIKCKENKKIGEQTLHTYARDLKTILYFFMRMDYMKSFKITLPKVDRVAIETYTDDELRKLLEKPNLKKCTFSQYRNYCIVCMLLSTGIRLSSLINIKIRDLDFDNEVVNITHTKNRKELIIPLNQTMIKTIKQYLKVRQCKSIDDYLFCNVYGKQLTKSTLISAIYKYNKSKGVEKTSIHKFRHTFAKKWVLENKSLAVLQKVLGHSSLAITENYINILISDIKKEMEDFNILEEFNKEFIKISKSKKTSSLNLF